MVRTLYIAPARRNCVIAGLQGRGESVAMLGDGVNDAAALRQADIGVAMGRRGTDVAKEAADVIIADDMFQTTEAAIEEGRVIFDNIRKFVLYLFSCNLAEILVLLVASLAGRSAPLLPLQILWLNLLKYAPALALAGAGRSRRHASPAASARESLLTRPMVVSTVATRWNTAVTMAAYWRERRRPSRARVDDHDPGLRPDLSPESEAARTSCPETESSPIVTPSARWPWRLSSRSQPCRYPGWQPFCA
jgi:magnesium-transporting ATPase (P-type)